MTPSTTPATTPAAPPIPAATLFAIPPMFSVACCALFITVRAAERARAGACFIIVRAFLATVFTRRVMPAFFAAVLRVVDFFVVPRRTDDLAPPLLFFALLFFAVLF